MDDTYESWGQRADEFENGTVCIGIDLGTTNSCVGYWKEGANHAKIINHTATDGKHKTVPSVVSFPSQGNPFVGFDAVEHEQKYEPDTVTIRSAKRLMGKTLAEMADEQKYLSYTLCDADGHVAIDLPSKESIATPSEVSAILLKYIKDTAEDKLGHQVFNCVLTVPAYFNESQRQSTLKAATMAGFQGIRLLNEPTAAAMAYGLFIAGKKRVAIFDFGGGTLDVSILSIDSGTFAVDGVGGDTHLGGEDINHLLVDFMLDSISQEQNGGKPLPLPLTRTAIIQLQQAAEHAKVTLSTQKDVSIYLKDVGGIKAHKMKLSRAKLESLCAPLLTRCVDITRDVLASIGLTPQDIDEVVLVGGSTRIPALRTKLSDLFDGKVLCTSVNADEVVASGAAIQAAILSGVDKRVFQDVLMMDVIPLSIGIEMADGRMEVLIPKNSRIPISVTKSFDTYEDHQKGITVEVFEGDHPVARDNVYLTYFNFTLPRHKLGKAGEFQHAVTLSMNENGVLQVKAGAQHEIDENEAAVSKKWIVVLGVYMACMAAMYVFVRVHFSTDRLAYTDQYSAVNNDDL
ncbi:hypothetical protein H257_01680 [Aphanomyces astaci]|uniref:Hsp70-like protein n=1 Tax=Aphanomyces astaci TaxID=112090 RepID=W4H3A1_APHAT|nr:hypothetical protein H257_01680 [Aphanomyces astaci]ETV86500.1 hypothetical protein H257_01680 [Aphanomyces astaci]|eukprot:XP_009823299.1 hypothetical protein H257_01680 [Aphanomyces astaci]